MSEAYEPAVASEKEATLIHAVAHDLRGPARQIGTLASWIRDDHAKDLPQDVIDQLETIQARSGLLQALIDDVARFLTVTVEDPSVADPSAVAQAAADACDLEGECVAVVGDASTATFAQAAAFEGLKIAVHNALHHHQGPTPRVNVSVSIDPGRVVRFEVSDDGAGVAPVDHERIFEPLTRTRPRDEVGGSGMGLAILRRLAAVNRGKLEFSSDVGQGTTLTMVWPVG